MFMIKISFLNKRIGVLNARSGKMMILKTDMAFTNAYTAPEFLADDEHVNFEKGDVYSLGMTLLNCGCQIHRNVTYFKHNQGREI